jgi:hypothetical protein
MRRGLWIVLAAIATAALVAIALALTGVTKRETTTTIERTVATTSQTPRTQTLPFDAEENTFMGNSGGTGCLVHDSEQICDCIYRKARSEGHAASELAALGPELPANEPKWYLPTVGRCLADPNLP